MRKLMACLAALVATTTVANAAVIVGTVPPNGFQYYQFQSTGGTVTFDIYAFGFGGGPNPVSFLDSMITVGVDDGSPLGSLTGAIVAQNDDSSGFSDGSTSSLDSYLSLNLPAGNYILAVGAFFTDESEYRSGVATSPGSLGDFQLTYTGATNLRPFGAVTPEPVSLLVFGGLVVGGGLVARRRLKAKVTA